MAISYLRVPQSSKNGIINLLEKKNQVQQSRSVTSLLNTTIDFYDFLSLKTAYFINEKRRPQFVASMTSLWFILRQVLKGRKDRCAVFGCNNDRLSPKKYTVKFSFCPKSALKY